MSKEAIELLEGTKILGLGFEAWKEHTPKAVTQMIKETFENINQALALLKPTCEVVSTGNDVICGDHWSGLSREMVDGNTGCPWCIVEKLTEERQELDKDFAHEVDMASQANVMCVKLQADLAASKQEADVMWEGLNGSIVELKSERDTFKDKAEQLQGDVEWLKKRQSAPDVIPKSLRSVPRGGGIKTK